MWQFPIVTIARVVPEPVSFGRSQRGQIQIVIFFIDERASRFLDRACIERVLGLVRVSGVRSFSCNVLVRMEHSNIQSFPSQICGAGTRVPHIQWQWKVLLDWIRERNSSFWSQSWAPEEWLWSNPTGWGNVWIHEHCTIPLDFFIRRFVTSSILSDSDVTLTDRSPWIKSIDESACLKTIQSISLLFLWVASHDVDLIFIATIYRLNELLAVAELEDEYIEHKIYLVWCEENQAFHKFGIKRHTWHWSQNRPL